MNPARESVISRSVVRVHVYNAAARLWSRGECQGRIAEYSFLDDRSGHHEVQWRLGSGKILRISFRWICPT